MRKLDLVRIKRQVTSLPSHHWRPTQPSVWNLPVICFSDHREHLKWQAHRWTHHMINGIYQDYWWGCRNWWQTWVNPFFGLMLLPRLEVERGSGWIPAPFFARKSEGPLLSFSSNTCQDQTFIGKLYQPSDCSSKLHSPFLSFSVPTYLPFFVPSSLSWFFFPLAFFFSSFSQALSHLRNLRMQTGH